MASLSLSLSLHSLHLSLSPVLTIRYASIAFPPVPRIGFAVKNVPNKSTLFVRDVVERGPADVAGLKDGDEIGSFNGTFKNVLNQCARPDALIPVEYMRDAGGVDNAISNTVNVRVGPRKSEVVCLEIERLRCGQQS